MAFHLGPEKLADLATAARMVADDSVVALGGGLSARLPMALVRQLIRNGTRGLHVVGSAHSIDVDMLVAAGTVAISEESYVGYEQDHGLAPAFRRAAETGAIEVRESCCDTILTQLRAAEMGLPFLPVRGIKGTDILALHPEYGEVTCPFTGERMMAVPALSPDYALIHAPMGDRSGNLSIDQPYVLDERFAVASGAVIATVDRIVSTAELDRAGVVIPGYRVAAVVETPFGAHPTSSYPNYAYDRDHLSRWVDVARSQDTVDLYLERYVTGADEAEYREIIGAATLDRLTAYAADTATWMEIFR